MFTGLETASEGTVECSLNRKATPACPTCLTLMLHTHHISLKIIFNLSLFFLLKIHLRHTAHLQETTFNCSSTTGHAQIPFQLHLWNEGEEAKIPRIPPTFA